MQLPTTVILAWRVTNQLRRSGLSKKCQVQAHMALTRAGSMAQDRARQQGWPLTAAYCQINQMAAVHSRTLETWMTQVGMESAFITDQFQNVTNKGTSNNQISSPGSHVEIRVMACGEATRTINRGVRAAKPHATIHRSAK